MFNDLTWRSTDNERECTANAILVSLLATKISSTHWIEILAQENLLQNTRNEWKGSHNKIGWPRFVLMQDSFKKLKSDSTSWQRTLTSSHNLQIQWPVVSTLCHVMKNQLTRKVGFEGTPKLGSYWKSRPVTCKVNMEWKTKVEFINKDHSHSCVRISHGLNKLVTDLIDKGYDDNEQETSETKTEAFALKTDVFAFASRSKAEAKPRRPTSACSSTRFVPIRERIWTDIEPGAQSNQAYPVARRLNTLLRHGQLFREEDGAIELWRSKDYLRNEFEHSQYWSDEMWKSKMAGGGGNKKRFQYCTDSSGQEVLYLRAELFKVI